MSKGFWSLSDFDIMCKKCGGKNIEAEERDGYIFLICNDCKKNKETKKFENEYGKVPEFITRLLKKDKKVYNELFNQNEQIINVLKEVENILNSDYEKGLKDGYDGGVLDKNISSQELIIKITELYNKIAGTFFIDYLLFDDDRFISLDLTMIKENGVGFEDDGCGFVSTIDYHLKFKDNEIQLNEYNPIESYNSDTLVMNDEIESRIELISDYLSQLKDIITKYKIA